MAVDPEMLAVPVSGGSLAVARWSGGGPVVVAAHGLTSSHRFWSVVVEHLGGALTFVAPDLRGRGASNTLAGPYGLDAHVSDLVHVLEYLRQDSVILLGHSMGGAVAVALAGAYPECVSALVLVDGGFPFREGHEPVGSEEELRAVLGPLVQRLRRHFPSQQAVRAFWNEQPAFSHGDVSDEVLAAYADYDVEGSPPILRSRTAVQAAVRDWQEIHQRPASVTGPRIKSPVVLIRAERGVQDEPVGLYDDSAVAAIRKHVPQLQDIRVSGTNHMTIGMSNRGAAVICGQLLAFRGRPQPPSSEARGEGMSRT